MSYHCVVKDCSNGSYRLNKWKKEICLEHNCRYDECTCPPPFKLYPFPTVKKNIEKRKLWIKLINRLQTGSKSKLFEPTKDSTVCSNHFVEKDRTFPYVSPSNRETWL